MVGSKLLIDNIDKVYTTQMRMDRIKKKSETKYS